MKGTIRPISRQAKCPTCGESFQHLRKIGYICSTCKTTPKRFFIDIFWQGQRPCICSDATGRKGRRSRIVIIPIHPEFYDYLADRVSNNLPEAFIFTNPRTGEPYSESSIQRLWDSVRRKAGISKDLRLYDASRHSFASQLINSDISILSVSRLLGHSSIKMTEKYAHSKIEKLRADMTKFSLSAQKARILTINKKSTPN